MFCTYQHASGRAKTLLGAKKVRVNALTSFVLVILTLCFTGFSFSAQAAQGERKFAAGRILVKPRSAVSEADFAALMNRHGGHNSGALRASRWHVVTVDAGQEAATVQALALDPQVEHAELDRLVAPQTTTANDPQYHNAWHLATLGAPTAWDIAKGAGVTVAILDSGVDSTHPDLAGKLVPGWNLNDNNSDTSDVYGHGTEVAGVVGAASNNSIGVTSIAWDTKIMPLRVTLTNGNAYISTIANGIMWAADHGAQIANASFADLTGSASIIDAANYMRSKGGLVVVAGGNSGAFDSTAATPAVISVSATTSSDALASWSSYGNYIDVAAPGAGIWTTTRGGGYAAVSGTSFASPVTAGVLALMKSANPSLSNTILESLLKSTAVDLGTPGYDQYFGYGRVNAAAAVSAAAHYSGTDTQPPAVSIIAPDSPLASTVTVSVSANDPTGIARVDLYAGTTQIGSRSSAPYNFTWNTTTVANGSVGLQAFAYDTAGNKGASTTVTVTIANPAASSPPPSPAAGSASGGGGGGTADGLSLFALLLLALGYGPLSGRRRV